MRRWLAGLLWLLGLYSAQAQAIDPLHRPQEEAGTLRYSFGLSYTPQSFQALGVDPAQGLFSLTQVQHGVVLSGSVRYALDSRWTSSLTFSPELRLVQSERRFAQETEQESQLEWDWSASLEMQARPGPESALDPRLSLALQYPWAVRYTLSASLLRDPVVLAASLALSDALDERPTSLTLALGAGFVANEQISFSLGKSLTWTIGALLPPGATLSLTTAYTLDAQSEQQLAARTSLSWQGEALRVGFGLEVGGLLR